jgi:hypothetical protein
MKYNIKINSSLFKFNDFINDTSNYYKLCFERRRVKMYTKHMANPKFYYNRFKEFFLEYQNLLANKISYTNKQTLVKNIGELFIFIPPIESYFYIN